MQIKQYLKNVILGGSLFSSLSSITKSLNWITNANHNHLGFWLFTWECYVSKSSPTRSNHLMAIPAFNWFVLPLFFLLHSSIITIPLGCAPRGRLNNAKELKHEHQSYQTFVFCHGQFGLIVWKRCFSILRCDHSTIACIRHPPPLWKRFPLPHYLTRHNISFMT